MKKGFIKDLYEKEIEITKIVRENSKKTYKYEEELSDLNHKYRICKNQLEEIRKLFMNDDVNHF
jgi:hypothetical protein